MPRGLVVSDRGNHCLRLVETLPVDVDGQAGGERGDEPHPSPRLDDVDEEDMVVTKFVRRDGTAPTTVGIFRSGGREFQSEVSLFCGQPRLEGHSNGDPRASMLSEPGGLLACEDGTVVFTDRHTVRKVSLEVGPGGAQVLELSTVAGKPKREA